LMMKTWACLTENSRTSFQYMPLVPIEPWININESGCGDWERSHTETGENGNSRSPSKPESPSSHMSGLRYNCRWCTHCPKERDTVQRTERLRDLRTVLTWYWS
jgi:hypothetical protein